MIGELFTQVIIFYSERNNDKSKTSNYFNKQTSVKKTVINPADLIKTPLKSPKQRNPKDFLEILQSIKDNVLFKTKTKFENESKPPPTIQPNITIKSKLFI